MHQRLIKLQIEDKFILEYMNMIGHWEFGNGIKPFIYGKGQINDLKKNNSNEVDYWISQWIFTYNWILENFKTQENLRIVCYEELCNNKQYRNKLYSSLGVQNCKNIFKLKVGESNKNTNKGECSLNKFNLAMDIYDSLKQQINTL